MPPQNEREAAPANPELADVRAKIKQCEAFINVCERIKQLEKLDESNTLATKIAKLQNHMQESAVELHVAIKNVQRHESVLSTAERPIGLHEREELLSLIRFGKTRIKTIQMHVDEEQAQISKLAQQLNDDKLELEALYQQLEESMQLGFHPNQTAQTLQELRDREEQLKAKRFDEVAIRTSEKAGRSGRQQAGNTAGSDRIDTESSPALKESIQERDFQRRFIEDLALAKNSVLIMSKELSIQRAGQIMPELAKLVANKINILIYTYPPELHSEPLKQESQNVIAIAHRSMLSVIMRSDLDLNVAIIDDLIVWEGGISILGPPGMKAPMKRAVGTSSARQLRKYITTKLT